MTTARDVEDLRREYSVWSTEDLLRVLQTAQDYRPEAVQVAREVLGSRDPSMVSALTESVPVQVQAGEAQQRAAEEPLTAGLKAMCFHLCGIPGIAFALYQDAKGRPERAGEAWQWIALGWGARMVLFLLVRFV